jgi:cell volume regulation protein A
MTPHFFSVESVLFVGSILVLLSIGLSKMSDRLGVPALLLFLSVGMLAGSEGLGGIHFDNAYFAQVLGVLSLAFILFSGGLDTRWKDIKPALGQGVLLSTLGVIVTAGIVVTSFRG